MSDTKTIIMKRHTYQRCVTMCKPHMFSRPPQRSHQINIHPINILIVVDHKKKLKFCSSGSCFYMKHYKIPISSLVNSFCLATQKFRIGVDIYAIGSGHFGCFEPFYQGNVVNLVVHCCSRYLFMQITSFKTLLSQTYSIVVFVMLQ